MVVALALIVGGSGWQSAQLDLSTQRINDSQDIFKSQGGLARFKINDEAHANPCRQSKLGLSQTELLASGTKCVAELLR
jgi:hypothetical protein